MRRFRTVTLVAAAALVAGCSAGSQDPADNDSARSSAAAPADATTSTAATGSTAPKPVDADGRAPGRGERFVDLALPAPYTPKAPTYGTDDYRCFLLDPGLERPAFLTGLDVLPGRRDLVHHVILFRVPPEQVDAAEAQDAETDGEGWTCFGGNGIATGATASLDAAPWLGAWAPGGGERRLGDDVGIWLDAGSQVIMQVHYNLLDGTGADTTAARLRLAPATAGLSRLETVLLPAPVELPCRSGHSGKLCDRNAAVADVAGRFGYQSKMMVDGLQYFCGGDVEHPRAGPVQSCERTVRRASTVRAVAGHMHLLGRSIRVVRNPGQPNERTLLDIPVWDFDDQGAIPLREPAELKPGDTLQVTCRHDQRLRDLLPSFEGQPERYVVWGEGTTDEMCLGILLVTYH